MKYLSILFVLIFAVSAHAGTFRVTRTDDRNVSCTSVSCSLREAITAANAAPGNDKIIFAFTTPTTINLNSELRISSDVDILGLGARN
jgi:CSLREA domain-containing protein